MAALPFARALEALKPIRFVGWAPYFWQPAVEFAGAADLVHCRANDRAAIMDYSIRFGVASVLPVT